ncbi:hypothetical protein [Exiguobacterium sp. S3]|uniref:hypothetical protein n=1 Tax=Exiguobacterium sp. S3 TaxID=483245 RepID=UPI001BE8366C|nr:hypothetical protein [Exiguobacterium sp. S3]
MHYITNVEILFESNSSGEPFPLHELAEKQSTQLVEILEDSDVTGNLHYIITYNGGHQKKLFFQKINLAVIGALKSKHSSTGGNFFMNFTHADILYTMKITNQPQQVN